MALIVFLVLVPIIVAISATIGACLVYAGWNWGVLAAFPSVGLGHLSFWQALCLGLIISVIGGAFKRATRSKR